MTFPPEPVLASRTARAQVWGAVTNAAAIITAATAAADGETLLVGALGLVTIGLGVGSATAVRTCNIRIAEPNQFVTV